MSEKPKTIKIDEVEYVRKDSISTKAESRDGMPYCIVRTFSAGVFAGFIERREGREVTMRDARRLWYWEGAASLSQLANEGVKKPKSCKFPPAVDKVVLLEAIEILDVTAEAKANIEAVPEWKA